MSKEKEEKRELKDNLSTNELLQMADNPIGNLVGAYYNYRDYLEMGYSDEKAKEESGLSSIKREQVGNIKVDTLWNGYCPESALYGIKIRMRLNANDFYESIITGIQIMILSPGNLAV